MGDFFSDSDGEKAVEEILSQAMDSTILEQVAAINCAGFTDSGLPSHLETRFQRLKSFPSSTAKPTSLSTKSFSLSHPPEFKKSDTVNEAKSSDSPEEKNVEKSEKGFSPCLKKSPDSKNWLSDSGSLSPFKKNPRGKVEKKGTKSPSSSSCEGFSSRSVSPPVKSGCFLCSPKKHDELLSDLSNFSVNSQRKMIKKAMEEEERICREADKIVKWAKHASARMDISGIEDELSDDENAKFP
ncbi:hypothetical protein Pfo_010590 [Paulownia fortunei]|nr:hypothetical protein Pfo_010590 [Paulownia fortunei]